MILRRNTITQSIAIVGAGVFGVAAALELRRRGHTVALFDPGPLPHPQASSTDISKIVRMDYGADEFYAELMQVALPRWQKEPLYHQIGFLLVTREEMRPGSFEYESFFRLRKRGYPLEKMNSKRLKAQFPAWKAENYTDGYYNPTAGWAESGKVVAKLIAQAKAAGVTLHEGKVFARLLEKESRVAGIVTADGETHPADRVIVAAGAWTPTLLPHLSELMWATGQPVLYFRPDNLSDYQPPHFVTWAADISQTGWYGFPVLADGTLKIGNHGAGIPIHPEEPRIVSPSWEQKCREFLRETFPHLADAPLIGSRLCLYCDSWDGNFYIDFDPERPGLLVAAGGSGHGFKFAPVIGDIIADVLEEKPNPFASRFAWRTRGQRITEGARCTKR